MAPVKRKIFKVPSNEIIFTGGIERFHSRGQQSSELIGTKEGAYVKQVLLLGFFPSWVPRAGTLVSSPGILVSSMRTGGPPGVDNEGHRVFT